MIYTPGAELPVYLETCEAHCLTDQSCIAKQKRFRRRGRLLEGKTVEWRCRNCQEGIEIWEKAEEA